LCEYRHAVSSCLAGAILLGIAGVAMGSGADENQPPPSPEFIEGATILDASSVIETAAVLEELVVIDARIRGDRGHGYIDGSISLPDKETDCASLAPLIPYKNHPVLFYCNGPKCGRSARSSQIALACGYTRIFWFRGGIEEWMNEGFPLVH